LIIIAESPQNRNESSPHPANAGYFPSLALGPIEEHLAMCAGSERRGTGNAVFPVLSSFGSRSDLSLRQRRNDGSDSRQLSIQSRLQLLEGGLDFRWRPALALIDEQSDYVIDFVRNGACCHFDLQ
jgi:hypothetical protein